MTRTSLPLAVDDLTGFCRALAKQLGDDAPSHLTLMNMVARAAGFENVQHLRAEGAAARRLKDRPSPAPTNARAIERALHQFDAQGRLKQWPAKRAVQTLALWALWARLPGGRDMSEREVNGALDHAHLFDDPATLRRTMIAEGLLTREVDGSAYLRQEKRPPSEALALIRELERRHQNA